MLRVQLLGELEAELDGYRVEPPASRRAWALLGWLALHPGMHARSKVAARFWPDVLDTSARASLRSAIWALRRSLGGAADAGLIAERDRLGLLCQTDLAEFDDALVKGRLEDAVSLSHGSLLADLDEDWVLEARDEHAERLGVVLGRLAAEAESPQDAVTWARRRVALDPLGEQSTRDLMRLLIDADDRVGARTAYDRLSERLRTALGLAPSARTRAILALARAPQSSVSPAPEGPPLVGREPELTVLLECFERARSGSGAIAVVRGEAGIGKTRLIAELMSRARELGAQTALCTAVDFDGAPPFGLWAELLTELGQILNPPAIEAQWPDELARLAPSFPRRLGRPARPEVDIPADLARSRLFEAVVELAEHGAGAGALLLAFEDVHVADTPSLELVAYLARRIERMPVLLVLSRRAVPRRDVIETLLHGARGRGVGVVELDLDPLNRSEVEAVVDGVAALTAADRDRVVARSDGNPLLALESARAVARGDSGPPSSLRVAVRAAVSRLSPEARRAAELISVAGRDLRRADLAALVAPEAVLEAMDCGLFRSDDGRFGFRHALLCDAVYADLDAARQLMLHETLGRSLSGQAAEAARHLQLAGRDDLAAERLVEAASDAMRATAFNEAVAYMREVVDLRPRDADPRRRLGAALALLGKREAAMAALDAAVALIDPDDAAERAAAYLDGARWHRGSLCDPAGAGAAAQAGLDALASRGLGEPAMRAELLLVRAWGEVTLAGAEAADGTLREFNALGLGLESRPLLRHDLETVRGFTLLASGNVGGAEELLVAAGTTAERAGRLDMSYGGWVNAACLAAAVGGLERALAHVEHGAALIQDHPIPAFELEGVRGYVLARLGRHDDARRAAERQAELAALIASPQLAATADHDGGILAAMAGDHDRAQQLLGRALAADPPVHRANARLCRAESLARIGRPDEADAEIRAAALEPITPAQLPAVLVARMTFAQALSARARGNRELAERRLNEAAAHWRRLLGTAELGRDYMASFIDLGRPPVTGIVDPEAELGRVAAEFRELTAVPI